MISLTRATKQQGFMLRQMYFDYQEEIGKFGVRDDKHFDNYNRKNGHAIYIINFNGKVAGFAFLRWKDVHGTELTEFYILPEFRSNDVAFLAFKLLSETWPGRWQGCARVVGNISAFWKWSIRRLKGNLENASLFGGEFNFSFYTSGYDKSTAPTY